MKRPPLLSLPLTALPLMALAMLPVQAQAKPQTLPDQFELGKNALGNPCLATRNWKDGATNDPFAVSFGFTCRGATANRFLGTVREVKSFDVTAIDATLECGGASEVTVPRVGVVRSRRCFDKLLGQETVETRFTTRGRVYSASAVSIAQGPAEEGLRILLGAASAAQDRGRTTQAAVDPAALAPAPVGAAGSAVAVADADAALQQGLRLVRQGLHLDASRVVNDALARLPQGAAPATRIDLLLLAGLADSNLRFFTSAEDYFARANALLLANPGLPVAAVLDSKRRNYMALHLLNMRDFPKVAGLLDGEAASLADRTQPLDDAATVRALNQRGKGAVHQADMVSTPDGNALSQLVIEAQSAWARSVALLGQNKPEAASEALAIADRNLAVLHGEPIRQQQLLWLGARIDRQRARLLLRQGDRAGALKALDSAIGQLRLAEDAGASGPTLAQTQVERAAVLAVERGDRELALAQFDDAVTSLLASDSDVGGLPAQTRSYLDTLVAEAAAHPEGPSVERFFKTLQATANPAIARQFVELQSLVSANPALAGKVQDRQEVEREISRLRFEIAAAANTDAAGVAALEARKAELENRSLALQSDLAADKSYVQVSDAPVTAVEVRKVLQPGEGYLKLSVVGGYVFGALIDGEGATIYRVARPAVEVAPLIAAVRGSITNDSDKVPVFSVAGASALYTLLAGPAATKLPRYSSLVIDASGVLDALPAGALVTDGGSVTAFAKSRKANAYDYTRVAFLARQTTLSTALSPRSLIVSRNLAPSRAPFPFIGFAQHAPASLTAEAGGQMVSVGNSCEVERSQIAQITNALKPIDARELQEAGAALGLAKVPEMIGADFTDTAVSGRTDLDQFQVLHFATHGVTEGVWACSKAPPALVTSLGDGASDGILSLEEVAGLRLDANLVVLSACDTAAGTSAGGARAAGNEQVGASLDGLVRAFLAARAHAVLSTYWPVSDAGETEALITDFYRAARSDTIGNALRQAQVALISAKATSHPVYWAPFFIVGDAQKPLLTGEAKVAVDQGAGNQGAGSSQAVAVR